jgi:glycosyltransferase involved in cell wall biosynthesis
MILGGAQENTLITCTELVRRGHQVTLITGPSIGPEGKLLDLARQRNFRVIVVDQMVREINPFKDAPAYLKLRKILTHLKPDIVHTHSAKAGIIGRVAAYALKGRIDRSRPNVPAVVHTIHGLAFHPYQPAYLNSFYKAVERYTARRTDRIISVADAMTQKALAAAMGQPDMYSTAYSAIEQDDYLAPPASSEISGFRRRFGINDQAIVLTTVARITELKGHEYIIDSARKLAGKYDNCVWLFVGDGSLTREMQSKLQMAGLSYRFKFTGLLPPSQIPLTMHASDIIVHPSLREGLARALPQAMLAGKPVVSFDIDGAREVVNQDTGFLVEPEDVDGLTEACEKLIAQPELRQKLGRAARAYVKDKFSPEVMVEEIERVYYSIIGREAK